MAAKFIVIFGPTASGKSNLALHLAQKIGAVIVNSDSQQVYKELRILSARPTAEEEALAPHYLFGSHSGAEDFSTGHWLKEVQEIVAKEKRPIIFCGGTGLYLHAMWNAMAEVPPIPDAVKDKVRAMPEAEVAAFFGADASDNHRRNVRALEVFFATGKHLKDWQREQKPAAFNPDDFLILVMNVSRETLYKNIDDRFLKMMENGAIDEARKLEQMRLNPALPIMKAVGVPELIKYMHGEMGLEEAISKAQQNSRNYAKRQLTWMRQQLPHKIEVQNMEYADIVQLVKEKRA